MKIPVILNGEKVILDERPEIMLSEVLRKRGLTSVKEGCIEENYTSSTVLLDDKPVPSCIIPVGIVRNASIETLEFFLLTREADDIIMGFKQAGLSMCGWCNGARIFSTYALLKKSYRPSEKELLELAESIECDCTDKKTFINGVLYATAAKHEREGRRNVII